MPEQFRIDDSRMPVKLGSAMRVPSYAYTNWGIPEGAYRIESDECYTAEWRGGSPRQMEYVIDAVKRAGFGNNSQILRDSCAQVVAHRVRCLCKDPETMRINYMDIGAGVSTVNAFDAVDDNYKDRLFITMVEPSEKRVEAAAEELTKRGLRRDKDFRVVVAPDQHLLAFVQSESQDIVTYVAVLHHHSYIDTPLRTVSVTMKPKGVLVVSDWHNPEWEHPNRVYRALVEDFDLDEYNWPTKDADMAAFVKAYPKALEEAPALSPLDEGSYQEIRGFWKGFGLVRRDAIAAGEFDESDDIIMLEAHIPVERQNQVVSRTGFSLNPTFVGDDAEPFIADLIKDGVITNNPHQLLKDSRLLMTTVANRSVYS